MTSETGEMATLAGGVGEETIQEAEAKLGVRFPVSYRMLLSQFGAALSTGFEIAGLFDASGDDPAHHSSDHFSFLDDRSRRKFHRIKGKRIIRDCHFEGFRAGFFCNETQAITLDSWEILI